MSKEKSDDRMKEVILRRIDQLKSEQNASYEGWYNSKLEEFKTRQEREYEREAVS